MSKHCEGCVWWEEFTWACCNGDSPHCADFVNCGCAFLNGRRTANAGAKKNRSRNRTGGTCGAAENVHGMRIVGQVQLLQRGKPVFGGSVDCGCRFYKKEAKEK